MLGCTPDSPSVNGLVGEILSPLSCLPSPKVWPPQQKKKCCGTGMGKARRCSCHQNRWHKVVELTPTFGLFLKLWGMVKMGTRAAGLPLEVLQFSFWPWILPEKLRSRVGSFWRMVSWCPPEDQEAMLLFPVFQRLSTPSQCVELLSRRRSSGESPPYEIGSFTHKSLEGIENW